MESLVLAGLAAWTGCARDPAGARTESSGSETTVLGSSSVQTEDADPVSDFTSRGAETGISVTSGSSDSTSSGTVSTGDNVSSLASSSSTEAGSTQDTSTDSSDTTAEAASDGTPTGGDARALDPFGIEQLYPSALQGGAWTAEHWSQEGPYSVTSRIDPNDPQQISGMRGTGMLEVTGDGELVMRGSQPRIYVYPGPAGPWRDVEVTVYYQRVADDETAYAGLVIGTRSGPEGHGEMPCDAHTYYSRLRHDGATDFEKELMHAPSSTRSRVDPQVLWPPDGALPVGRWIGWKFVIYNLAGGGVKLEAYRDLQEGRDGGAWELVNEAVDEGGWFTETSCEEHAPVAGESDMVVLEGGTTFIRNTGVEEARYRWFSIREIEPPV